MKRDDVVFLAIAFDCWANWWWEKLPNDDYEAAAQQIEAHFRGLVE